jgi:hypothetical protein
VKTGMEPFLNLLSALRYALVAYRGMRKDRAAYLRAIEGEKR